MKRDSLHSIMAAVAIALTVFVLPVRAAAYDAEAEEVCESASEEQIPDKEESDQTNEDTALPLSGESGRGNKARKTERDGDKEPEDVKPDPDKTEPEDGKEEGNNQETEKSDEKEEKGGDVTDTGDDSDPWVFGALLMFSLMGIFVIRRKQIGAARNEASWRE